MDYSTRRFLIDMNAAMCPILFLSNVPTRELDPESFIDFAGRVAGRIVLLSDFDKMCSVAPSIDHDRVSLTTMYCIGSCDDGRPNDALEWLLAAAKLVGDKKSMSNAIENVLRGME